RAMRSARVRAGRGRVRRAEALVFPAERPGPPSPRPSPHRGEGAIGDKTQDRNALRAVIAAAGAWLWPVRRGWGQAVGAGGAEQVAGEFVAGGGQGLG